MLIQYLCYTSDGTRNIKNIFEKWSNQKNSLLLISAIFLKNVEEIGNLIHTPAKETAATWANEKYAWRAIFIEI